MPDRLAQASSDPGAATTPRSGTALAGVSRAHGDAREHFWRVYLAAGLSLLGAETLVILGYLMSTPHGPHRLGLLVVTGAALAIVAVLLPFVPRVAASTWRARFGLTMVLAACLVLALCSIWDGGIDSPPLDLISLPVMWAAVGLSSRAVAACGLASMADVALVGVTDSSVTHNVQAVVLLFAVVVGVAVLSYVASLNRGRLEGKEAELGAKLAWLADTDGLTGCFNHRVFERSLSAEVDRALRHHTPLCLLVADVDLLKTLNDTRGHAAGDAALATVGSVLRSNIRSFDVAARTGGDEFAVVLPNASLAEATAIAQRMSRALDRAGDQQVTVSIGVACLDAKTPTVRKLTRDADVAMYAAKANGRHGVASADHLASSERHYGARKPSGCTRAEDHTRLEEQVRRADREKAQASTVLDTLLATAPVGLGFVDRDFRIVRVNATLAAINGSTVDEQIGRTVDEVVPEIWPQVKDAFHRVVETGTPVLGVEVMGKSAAEPGEDLYWLASYYPVRLDDAIIGVGIVVVDITERRAWELRRATMTHHAVGALAATIEARDPYTAGHQRMVADLAGSIAAELGVDDFSIEGIMLAATIHDIGKIAIPSEILTRPGDLSQVEMDLVRTHCRIGFDILAGVDFPWPVREMVVQHHERLDGSGYPDGLRGDQILVGSRIIAVADVVDAISSHRPYRPAIGLAAAIESIEAGSGTLFDPAVVQACVRVLRRNDQGLRDRLTSGGVDEPRPLVQHPAPSDRAESPIDGCRTERSVLV